jgi:hypothetical protein
VIKTRGNSWWVVVYTGRDPLTGKKRQKTGTAKTRAEARQLEARLIREAGTGQHRAAGNKTVPSCWTPGANGDPRKGEIADAHFQAAQDRTAAELMEGLIRLPQATSDG